MLIFLISGYANLSNMSPNSPMMRHSIFSIISIIGSLSSIAALYLSLTLEGTDKSSDLVFLLIVASSLAVISAGEHVIRNRLPRCLPNLEVFAKDKDSSGETKVNGEKTHSLFIVVQNYESTNVRISGVVFWPYRWESRFGNFRGKKTRVKISPYAQRIGRSDKCPLKFGQDVSSGEIPTGTVSFVSNGSTYVNMDEVDSLVVGKKVKFDSPEVMLGPQKYDILLLPVAEPVEDIDIKSRRCGTVDLKYKTDDGRRGLHRVRV